MEKNILLFTENIEEAEKEIKALGGRVIIVYNKVIFVASVPEEFDESVLTMSSATAPEAMDSISEIVVGAWQMKQEEDKVKKAIKGDGLPWDAPGYQYPRHPGNDPELARMEEEFFKIWKREDMGCVKLAGKFALGLVLVSGKRDDLGLSSEEKMKIVSEVSKGICFLVLSEPLAEIQCLIEIRDIGVNVEPAPGCNNNYGGKSFEECQRPWRDAAFEKMGFSRGYNGLIEYLKKLMEDLKVPFSSAGFVTKYPLYWFAYSDGLSIYMNYFNDNWGIDNIHRVFTHETCHVFKADDEYAGSECKCESRLYGCFKVPNLNCINCGQKPHVACIMDQNTLEICPYTRGQMGWNFGFEKIEAAVSGQRKFSRAGYVFAGDLYIRWNWGERWICEYYPRPVGKYWMQMPDDFKGDFDAVFNGAGDFDGKCFFFKGDRFVVYGWEEDRCLTPSTPIKEYWTMLPADFQSDIQAAVTYDNCTYFFKGDLYAAVDWKTRSLMRIRNITEFWDPPRGFYDNFDALINYESQVGIFKGDQFYVFVFEGRDKGKRHPVFSQGSKSVHDFIPGLIRWPVRTKKML